MLNLNIIIKMKKFILVILLLELCFSFASCVSPSRETINLSIYDTLESKGYISDKDKIMYLITTSSYKLQRKIYLREKWSEAINFFTAGLGGISTATIAFNQDNTNMKNIVGIITALMTVGTGIVANIVTPNKNDITCVEQWENYKKNWEEAKNDSMKSTAWKKALMFGVTNGLITTYDIKMSFTKTINKSFTDSTNKSFPDTINKSFPGTINKSFPGTINKSFPDTIK
jgi:hypothetical protein